MERHSFYMWSTLCVGIKMLISYNAGALLNAIVSKRVMEFKMPGNSYVVGSETGFGFSEDMKGIESSRVIYLEGWNGKELQAPPRLRFGCLARNAYFSSKVLLWNAVSATNKVF